VSVLIKSGTLHANLAWLTKEKKLEAVLERVPPETAALMRNPPAPHVWMDAKDVEPILCALEAIDGKEAVLRMAREKLRSHILPPLARVVSAVLQLFGASPARVFRHIDQLVGTSAQGILLKYRPTTDRSGVMEVSYAVEREVPTCTFISMMATLELYLELCAVRGTVSEPERTGPASARFAIAWTAL
jgi:hypothetical protein